jgi:regulatory protein
MKKITALRLRGGRRRRILVYLDGRYAFGLEAEVAAQQGLRVGEELDSDRLADLTRADAFQRCLNAAHGYLSYRPRSEFELRERLSRRGFDDGSVEAVLVRLKEAALVDDAEFARFWQDNRQAFSPRSGSLTRMELRRKGVAEEVVSRVTATVSDDESAYRAAQAKARRLPLSDYQAFRRRLGGYLRRRGFDYGVISKTVAQLWQEMRESNSG